MRLKISLRVVLFGFGLGLSPWGALAQTTEPLLPIPLVPAAPQAPALPDQPSVRGQTVTERARPEVEALGVPVGNFFFFPRLEVGEFFNDNIFATSSNRVSDFITVIAPAFDLKSDFTNHALNVSGGAAIGQYARNPSQNFNDAYGAVNGRIDVDRLHQLYGGARVDHLHEPLTSPDAPGDAAQPVKYLQFSGLAGFAQNGLRTGYDTNLAFVRQQYDDVPAIGGGTIPQGTRNNNAIELAVRGTYEFVPNYQGFVRAAGNVRRYDNSVDGNPANPNRDSNGFRADIGARIDLTGVTYVEVFAGYLAQYYTAPLSNITGLDAGANIVWNVTPLTTISLRGERSAQDTNDFVAVAAGTPQNSPGYLLSTANLNIDHELLRNLLLNAQLSYENDDFIGIQRTDNIFAASVGAKYLLSRYVYLGANYVYAYRTSSGASAINPYSNNIVLFRVGLQL